MRRALDAEELRRLCRARDLLADPDLADAGAPTIERVARLAGYSRYHFIRRFDAVFGATPHQYRIDVRPARAKHLLATGRSVTEACMDVGFSSVASFSHLFRRRVGQPPSAFRRRLVQVPGAWQRELYPGCLTLMGRLPATAFRNSR